LRAISAFVLTVISLALFSLAKPQLDLRLKRIKQAKQEYQQSIIKTYQSLTTVAYEILDDTNLLQNLEWDLAHSNDGILRRYIYPGRISFIRVVTPDCGLVSHTESGVISGSPCLSGITNGGERPEITWLEQSDKPLVTLSMPFTAKQTRYILLIGTYLDYAWFHRHPTMDQLRQALKLEINAANSRNSGLLLHEEGFFNQNQTYIANLYSQDWLLKAAPFLFHIKPNALNQVVFYLGLLTLLLLAAVIVLLRRQESRLLQSLEEFQSWVKNLTKQKDEINFSKAGFDPRSYLLGIRESIKQLHNFHFNRDRDLQAVIDSQKHQHAQLEKDFIALQQKYYTAQRVETLYSQFQQTSEGFIGLQSQIYEQTENLADALSHGMSQQANELYKIIQKWEKDLALMSPRKFVRSLAERPSTQDPTRAELEIEVEKIVKIANYISHISLHLSIEVQKILQQVNQGLQIAQHWGATQNQEGRKGQQLISVILEAQNLVPMSNNIPAHQFINLAEGKVAIDHIDLPHSIWVSVIYHLYMTLIEIARPFHKEAIRIQSRVRQQGKQLALVLSIEESDRLVESPKKSDRAGSHFDLVKQLIRPYALQVIELPHLHSSISLALTWQELEAVWVEHSKRRIEGASKAHEADF